MASVIAVCVSEEKGVVKKAVPEIYVKAGYGVVGDAHAGEEYRQVSLLASESVDKLRGKMPDIDAGAFAENILTSGICHYELPIGTKLRIGKALLEVTQIGKECHNDGCAIKRQTGDCVMPREGIFASVLEEGSIRPGDKIEVERAETFSLETLHLIIKDRKINKKPGSYTNYLFEKGVDKILKKLGEEAIEVIIAGKAGDKKETVYELADLTYHAMVLMAEMGITPDDVIKELASRHITPAVVADGDPPVPDNK